MESPHRDCETVCAVPTQMKCQTGTASCSIFPTKHSPVCHQVFHRCSATRLWSRQDFFYLNSIMQNTMSALFIIEHYQTDISFEML